MKYCVSLKDNEKIGLKDNMNNRVGKVKLWQEITFRAGMGRN
ncbi:MAG: hypothetical protein QHH74_09870 [Spirochaetota bacterium]|nr:hypothetical protein [Spirochaetota bacterium]